jgi:ferredoxin-NADP reductase
MRITEARLVGSECVAEGTMAFRFERPAGFDFVAGQFANVTLPEPPETDDEGDMRSFSIASAPYEDELTIATRMRDTAFKRTLREMRPGDVVEVDGPYGDCILDDDTRVAVFLAGGIGITPFRSIVRQAAHERCARPRVLFYANRRPEDSAFLDELDVLSRNDPPLRVVGTMTGIEPSIKQAADPRGVREQGSRVSERHAFRDAAGCDAMTARVVDKPGQVGDHRTGHGSGVRADPGPSRRTRPRFRGPRAASGRNRARHGAPNV